MTASVIDDLDAMMRQALEEHRHPPKPVLYWSERRIRVFLLALVRTGAVSQELANAELSGLGLRTPIYGPHQQEGNPDG